MGQKTLAPLSTPQAVAQPEKCSGCGRCVAACREKLYTLQVIGHRKQALNKAPQDCSCCGRCLTACPLDLIR